eukprot:TRINITY_DN103358_c0_g1_i1.p1 TRINITY_DN103358_c0_g1~~TRINITY_DN103358_c0_g1_i1.p1  ORF type:complete len:305 (-),score=45.98 TRINITY_DN103358_c0_g1_i1:353-1267(-)
MVASITSECHSVSTELTAVSAPPAMTRPQCFPRGTPFARAGSGDLVAVKLVRTGDELKGPHGNALLTIIRYEGEGERDFVDIVTSGGSLPLTKDHRVEVLRGNKHLVCAAGDLRAGNHVFTGPEETLEVQRIGKRICSNGVFFMQFRDDVSVYIRSASEPVVSKGCPGDPLFRYAALYGSHLDCQSSRDDSRPSRRSQSAPTSRKGLQQRGNETSVIFKRRRIDDPPVFDILQMLASRAQCGDMLSHLDLQGGSKHEVILPSKLAEELRCKIKQVYKEWCDERLAKHHGRSSKLVWKHLASRDS